MSQSHTSFLGIPVEGDITRGDKREQQRPIEDLQPLLRAVLDDPFVVEFGWKQYTPYFNDGDPCTFGVGTPWFRTTSDLDQDETYSLELLSHPTLGGERYDAATRSFLPVVRTPEAIATYGRCKVLNDAVEGGAFEDVLLEAFGDHAIVKVKPTGITVEFYEHD